jgi:hypothetical protein
MELKYNVAKNNSPLVKLLEFDTFKLNPNLIFQYSKYINGVPGTGKVELRVTKRLKDISSFYKDLELQINNLAPKEELAIHSIIIKDQIRYHIPFIDFAEPSDSEIFDSISKLQEIYNSKVYLFKTGRSFHAYFDCLLTDHYWKKFLGHLLLLNVHSSSITDTRWIGHSIIQGFSSLRLSCNTEAYLSIPKYWTSIPKKS